MQTSLTIFKSKFDSKTHKSMNFDSFDGFEKLLYDLATVVYKRKEDAPLISPATFVTNENAGDFPNSVKESNKYGKGKPWYHRKNVNVVDWGAWACLDVDTWIPKGDLKDELNSKFGDRRFVCYSTASSTVDRPKFRLVFPLNKRVPHDQIRAFWHALAISADLDIDAQCKDLSRMYYVPANYRIDDSSSSFIFSGGNSVHLDVDALIQKYPAPPPRSNSFFDNLPVEIQQQIIEHKKQQLDNTKVEWTSYKNCPYWPKKLATEYMTIGDAGWYHKLYQIMVATASSAIRDKYPITSIEIAQLCFEFDADTGGWYKNRPLEGEANRALEYVYRNG